MFRGLSTRPRVTPRLELRPFRRRDLDGLVEAVQDSWRELAEWLPWAHAGYGRSDAIRFLRDSSAAWTEGRAFDFSIKSRKALDHHVGNISIWPTSRRERSGELGYWIRSTEAGKGTATEAAARVLQVGFEELSLHRVTVRIATGNLASERVAEKLGFVREGLLRKEVLVHGVWMDHSLWAILEEEFRANRASYVESGLLEV
jgi:ribosomal-protein-serine acetyltransferase